MIYLDNSSMTRPLPCAIEAFREAPFGNPSSGHLFGQRAREALEESRAVVAECMGCKPDGVFFVSTATEAIATVVNSYPEDYPIAASKYEHHSVLETIKRKEIEWKYLSPLEFHMVVNNETGDIFYDKIKHMMRTGPLVCDATSAVGHIPVSYQELNCEYLIADAIKFGGVPGAAFVITEGKEWLTPLFRGGGQERGVRAGTENVPAICAMAAALKWQCENMERNLLHVTRLRAEMLNRLKGTEYLVNAVGETSPYILNLSFPGTENGALVLMLSNRGVMVSAGAACTTGDNAPSHVLMAMYGDEARARSAIRISFAHDTTEDEVRIAASEIVDTVALLRGMGT